MKIIKKIPSQEICVEAGWSALDFYLDEKITKEFVLSLRPLGSVLLMDKLKKPFFKIESDNYIIKGILGEDFFRIASHASSDEVTSKYGLFEKTSPLYSLI